MCGLQVTGTGITGAVTVVSISGMALVLSSAQSIASGVTLTFRYTWTAWSATTLTSPVTVDRLTSGTTSRRRDCHFAGTPS